LLSGWLLGWGFGLVGLKQLAWNPKGLQKEPKGIKGTEFQVKETLKGLFNSQTFRFPRLGVKTISQPGGFGRKPGLELPNSFPGILRELFLLRGYIGLVGKKVRGPGSSNSSFRGAEFGETFVG